MTTSWFPLALVACVGSSFALWYSLDDWERARYFPIIAGLPLTLFAVIGIFGRS